MAQNVKEEDEANKIFTFLSSFLIYNEFFCSPRTILWELYFSKLHHRLLPRSINERWVKTFPPLPISYGMNIYIMSFHSTLYTLSHSFAYKHTHTRTHTHALTHALVHTQKLSKMGGTECSGWNEHVPRGARPDPGGIFPHCLETIKKKIQLVINRYCV